MRTIEEWMNLRHVKQFLHTQEASKTRQKAIDGSLDSCFDITDPAHARGDVPFDGVVLVATPVVATQPTSGAPFTAAR